MRFYISFGQVHAHSIDGLTYDKDSLMAVDAPNEIVARLGVNKLTGGKWSSLYQENQLREIEAHFCRGVINADKPVEVYVDGHGESGRQNVEIR